MFVNKFRFANDNLIGDSGLTINVPIVNHVEMSGQQQVVDRDFVDVEVNNAINPIFDYEKVKLLPMRCNNIVNNMCVSKTLIDTVLYKVNVLNKPVGSTPTFNTSTKWGTIDEPSNPDRFNDDDLRFKKFAFTKSFLRLDFYDTDIVSNQKLISFITLYPKISYDDVKFTNQAPKANNYALEFKLGNPLIYRKKNGEGFSLYHFKDELLPTMPLELYMRATFNNAKSGKSIGLMSSNQTNLSIDNLIKTTAEKHKTNTSIKNNLFTRYVLRREEDGYFYEIDTNYSTNAKFDPASSSGFDGNKYTVNLYEITAT